MEYSALALLALTLLLGIFASVRLYLLKAPGRQYVSSFFLSILFELIIYALWISPAFAGFELMAFSSWQWPPLANLLYSLLITSAYAAMIYFLLASSSNLCNTRGSRILSRSWLFFTMIFVVFLSSAFLFFQILPFSNISEYAYLLFYSLSNFAVIFASILIFKAGKASDNQEKKKALYFIAFAFMIRPLYYLCLMAANSLLDIPTEANNALNFSKSILLYILVLSLARKAVELLECSDSTGIADIFIVRHKITKREKEVLELICLGKTNREIAAALFISEQTVKGHVYNLFRKTGAENRVQLVNATSKNH